MSKLEELYAFVAEGADGNEGMLGERPANTTIQLPLIGTWQAVKGKRELAQQVANSTGKAVTLRKYVAVEDVEVVEPKKETGLIVPGNGPVQFSTRR